MNTKIPKGHSLDKRGLLSSRVNRLRKLRLDPAQFLLRVIMALIIIINVIPVVYMVGISLKPSYGLFVNPLNPIHIPMTLNNYLEVWSLQPIVSMTVNSLVVAAAVTLGQLFVSVLAAFGFSFYRFALRGGLFGLVLLSMMVPFVVTYLPNYLLMADAGLLDTLPGIILPMLGLGVGLPLFLIRQHFLSFPSAIMDAAKIDGVSDWQMLWRVVLPGTVASVAAVGVYVFVIFWNQYIWPNLVAETEGTYTLMVGVVAFTSGEGGAKWGPVMAISTFATIPTLVLFLALRRAIIENLSEGAIK